ncbi:MAG: alpha/beta hydrolase [Planctomycetes bacterium]|nr:alpha/beta hydrolase [Planctomycetota bacterium]
MKSHPGKTEWRRPAWMLALLVLLPALLVGCSGPKLADTPNLFIVTPEVDPFAEVPPAHQGNVVEVAYFTDRVPEERPDGSLRYGYGRSNSLALGLCNVSIGRDVSWEELVELSRSRRRNTKLPLRVIGIEEIVRAPSSIPAFVEEDGHPVPDPEQARKMKEVGAAVSELLTDRLRESRRKEVFLFVHGFNNTFEESMYRMAQLWHFIGREGLPIAYTWPAGAPGLLRGYTRDRESGEFTVYHLRETLRFLAGSEAVERIHIVAHSRGCDVAMSALRELHLQCIAAGLNTRETLKLGTVILAAADLDIDVVGMRIAADGLHLVPENLTMYLSEDDEAIGIASWLFRSVSRLGQLDPNALSPEGQRSIKLFPEIQFVQVDVRKKGLGHGYFIDNPAVLSDLILVLRDGRRAGAEHGRPLEPIGAFWHLDRDYPQFDEPVKAGGAR